MHEGFKDGLFIGIFLLKLWAFFYRACYMQGHVMCVHGAPSALLMMLLLS